MLPELATPQRNPRDAEREGRSFPGDPRPIILGDEVHVWRVPLDLPPGELDRREQLLSRDERNRADRFRFTRDRQRYVSARAVLRMILARYMASEPGQLCFVYGAHGKPQLERGTPGGDICFNISHSAGLGLFAFALDRRVGVDLEVVRPLEQIDALADCFLTTAERQELREQPEARRSEAFLRLWTRREAYLKATGIGISGLDHDVVPTTDAARGWTGAPAHDWCVEQFVPAKGYVAALVVEGVPTTIEPGFDFSEPLPTRNLVATVQVACCTVARRVPLR